MINLMKQKEKIEKTENQIINIATGAIAPNPAQPRTDFDDEHINELADSIKRFGLIQPIVVRKKNNAYQLISGERRLRAAKKAGLPFIKAIVVDTNDVDAAAITMVENLIREDLNFVDEAKGIKKLRDEFNLSNEEIANMLGKSKSTVSNKIRILNLNKRALDILLINGFTERHARALLCIENQTEQLRVAYSVVENEYNVKQTEELVERVVNRLDKEDNKRICSFKDMRFFTNTINQAIKAMEKSGIKAQSERKETEEVIEYIITIPKINIQIPTEMAN